MGRSENLQARRLILITIVSLYAAGLIWGYFRLPWAAMKNLGDYRLIAEAEAVSLAETDVSALQLNYLRGALSVSTVSVVPRASVAVSWNALVIARVKSGHYIGNEGAENQDVLYVCLFGAWVPVYTYYRAIA